MEGTMDAASIDHTPNQEAGQRGIGLLDLDDFCLSAIISYLDCKAFGIFRRTCSRFNDVASDRYSWNSSVLFRRISFLIQNAWFEGWFENQPSTNFKNYPKCNLSKVMKDGLDLGTSLTALSNGMARFVWNENSPVIAKLYSYLVHFTTEEIHNHPQSNWLIKRKNFCFEFPIDNMVVQISHLDSYSPDYLDDTDNDSEEDEQEQQENNPRLLQQQPIKIKGYQNGKCIVIYRSDFYDEPHTRVNSDTEDQIISNDLHSLQEINNIFLKNLPEMNMKFTPEMLIDLLLSLPHKAMKPSNLYFQSVDDNREPRWDNYNERLAEIRKGCIEAYHKKTQVFLTNNDNHKSLTDELIYHLGVLLEKRSNFVEYVDRFYHMSAKIGFDLLMWNKEAVKLLVRRINVLSSSCSFDSKGVSECNVEMKIVGDKNLTIVSSWFNDTKLGMEDRIVNDFTFLEEGNTLLEWSLDPLLPSTESLENLNPITKLLQECVDEDMGNTGEIPFLTNKTTAQFFMAMIKGLTKGISGVF